MSRILTAHVPFDGRPDGDGTDVLVTVWDDDTFTVALRPGRDQRGWTWGPPAELKEEEQP